MNNNNSRYQQKYNNRNNSTYKKVNRLDNDIFNFLDLKIKQILKYSKNNKYS